MGYRMARGAERALSSLANSGVVCVVGASDQSDSYAVFGGGQASNYGSVVTVFAPGLNDYAASFPGAFGQSGYYIGFSGTSGATPVVAGIAAQYLQTHPTANNAQVKAWLISNTTVGALYNIPANIGTANRLIYTNQ